MPKTHSAKKTLPPVKTSIDAAPYRLSDFRATLLDDLDLLRHGEISTTDARIRADISNAIINSMRLDCEANAPDTLSMTIY
jgi:hypothetical protein